MVELAWEYLTLRRQLGYALVTPGKALLAFARYADSTGHRGPVTIDLAVRWAKLPRNAKPDWWARRLQIVRGFAQHQRLFEPDTEVPPSNLLGPYFRRSTPHIYSDAEICALLRAAKDLGPAGGLRCHSYTTLFGLLISTGLRISEALHLKRDEVDLQSRVLTVALSKFRKSRMLPLHPSTTQALAKYAKRRDRYHPDATTRTFFINERGTPMAYSGVIGTFTDLRCQLGWTKNREGRRPRLHDMRHTMAVRTLLRWCQQGADVDQKILALCTYLGHVEITDTYWYLTAVPELMELTAARFQAYSRHNLRRGR
jgi:site-specific recombinase XerD